MHSKLVTMEIEEGREREDLPMTSGGWIMLNSAVASLPAKVRIASSPPGWSGRNFVTFKTSCGRLGIPGALQAATRAPAAHLPAHDDPAVLLRRVLRHLIEGVALSTASSRRRGRRTSTDTSPPAVPKLQGPNAPSSSASDCSLQSLPAELAGNRRGPGAAATAVESAAAAAAAAGAAAPPAFMAPESCAKDVGTVSPSMYLHKQ